GTDPDITIDALYAFTDCEIPLSPNACVIRDEKPIFAGVSDILKVSADNTVKLLTLELKIRLDELDDVWHYSSLEKIFIENELYEPIKECKTEESIIETIGNELKPYRHLLRKDIIRDDLVKLSVIPIKRISRFSTFKADEFIKQTETEMEEVKNHLANIIPYTISYYRQIRKKYGAGKERKTEIREFDTITATEVAVANERLYINRAEGFIGTGLKKDEYVCDCSDIDDVLIIRKDGKYLITKVSEKQFVGKDIEYAGVFKKNDERTIYNVIYRDGEAGIVYIKRCAITSLTRDKEYNLTKNDKCRILYMTVNPNGEAETVKVTLKPRPRIRNLVFDVEFSETDVKGKASIGNILTRYPVHKIELKVKGGSTLGGKKIWWDQSVLRLNDTGKGEFLGEFSGKDRILVITRSGIIRLSGYELSIHFEEDVIILRKYDPKEIFSAVYYDGNQKLHYLKRFHAEATEKPARFTEEDPKIRLILLSDKYYPRLEIKFGGKHKKRESEIIEAADFIAVKSFKAKGKRLSSYEIASVTELEPVRSRETASNDKTPTEPEPVNDNPDDHDTSDKGEQMSLF
ncbi:MAG TPA: DNA gyrase subunit A, partial [Bacteroidales bacterium]|nr:DNA gyrase subunit A [Bacteroidales bacterium]